MIRLAVVYHTTELLTVKTVSINIWHTIHYQLLQSCRANSSCFQLICQASVHMSWDK